MQNSFCKSPYIDYNKYANISPLIPYFHSEREKKDCENSDWVGNFLNKNIINNQSGRIKLNLELTDIMTPQHQNKNEIFQFQANHHDTSNNFFKNARENNCEVNKKEEVNVNVRSENYANLSDIFMKYNKSFINNISNQAQVSDNQYKIFHNVNEEKFLFEEENQVKWILPIHTSILKTTDKKSSFFSFSPCQGEKKNIITNSPKKLIDPVNLSIFNNNENNFLLKDEGIEIISNSINRTGTKTHIRFDKQIKEDEHINNKIATEVNQRKMFFNKSHSKNNNKKELYNYKEDKFKNQIKDIIKLSEERQLVNRRKIIKNNRSRMGIYNDDKCNTLNNSFHGYRGNHYVLKGRSELSLSNLVKNSASNNSNDSRKIISSFFRSKINSPLDSEKIKGIKYKKGRETIDELEINRKINTQLLEINNLTMPILSNEIAKSDSNYKNDPKKNNKLNNEHLLLGKKKDVSKFNKIQKTKIPKEKAVKVELVERNNFEECDLKYLINPSTETLNLNASCNYFNRELKNEYLQYLIYGRSNEKNLSFGSDPLIIYKDLTAWYLREKNNLENPNCVESRSTTLENFIRLGEKMNELNKTFNSLPILRIPTDIKYLPYSSVNKKKKNTINLIGESELKKFECKICHLCFKTGQGLGGHVSRIHQGQSENYNKKKATRLKREEERKRLYAVKRKILEKYGHKNYDYLIKQKHGKMIIKKVIEENYQEYVKLKREMKKEATIKK